MRILGVDPGSIVAGYGCIEVQGRSLHYITHGIFKLGDSEVPIEQRLERLHEGLGAVLTGFSPVVVAVEKAFVAKNAASALRLGEARGVILLAAKQKGLRIVQHTPTEIKSALCGFGRAGKDQIQNAVQMLLGRQHFVGKESRHDATDALALAICASQLTRRAEVETFR